MNKYLSLNDWNLIYDKLTPFIENINQTMPSDQITKISISQSNIQMNVQWLKKHDANDDFLKYSQNSKETEIFRYILDIGFEVGSILNEFIASKQNEKAKSVNTNVANVAFGTTETTRVDEIIEINDENDEKNENNVTEIIENANVDEIIEINDENDDIEATETVKMNEINQKNHVENQKDAIKTIENAEIIEKAEMNKENEVKISTKVDHKLKEVYVRLKRINIEKYLLNPITKKRSYSAMKNNQSPLKSAHQNNLFNNESTNATFSSLKYSTPKPKNLMETENIFRNEISCIPIVEENDENIEKCNDKIDDTPMVPIKKKIRKMRPLYLVSGKKPSKLNKNNQPKTPNIKSKTKSKSVKKPLQIKEKKKHVKRIISMDNESSLFEPNKNQTKNDNKIL